MPTLIRLVVILLVLVVAAGVYGMFEFGRYRAGFDVVAGMRDAGCPTAVVAARGWAIVLLRKCPKARRRGRSRIRPGGLARSPSRCGLRPHPAEWGGGARR